MSVWEAVVGQPAVVAELGAAVAAAAGVLTGDVGTGMTHAWLLTGPPGSGRSTAARAFAAALQCPGSGCGRCAACHTVLTGTHADVEVVNTELLSIGVDLTRPLVRRAALSPAGGRWQVLIMEDADRLTEQACDVLLKSLEEPPPRTVWLLCVPSPDDLVPTIRSRCRVVSLRTPSTAAVAAELQRRDQVDSVMATFAARASQGHIGRARRLATDERARRRRHEVLALPLAVQGVSACLVAAANLVDAAGEEAKEASAVRDSEEGEQLRRALGEGTVGRSMPRQAGAAVRELEDRQKVRAKRLQRDALDRALVDLASFYRDVLALQVDASVELTNDELRPQLHTVAQGSTPAATLRRIEAVLSCREAVDANVAPLLAVEAMALALRVP